MWATIYQGRKMFQRTSEQGGMPADVVELLKMSPYRPNLIVMDGRIYIWLRVNYMPLPQRFSELSAGKRSDSVDEGTASQARPRYGDCRPNAVGWPRLSGHELVPAEHQRVGVAGRDVVVGVRVRFGEQRGVRRRADEFVEHRVVRLGGRCG